ncbi:hypothetical protein M440DRAFT_1399410 [Trichoderma longibrachiatum ATCC 18648]|uniref:Uncharacterized protein n=1 Tax=Trichoderma longibrachiatum ATCC 18648 TaxID=983965 RepID=A0A2T4C9L1_TRILO|nr:hypothetical protein M440DRAFT_1399410 [Trichoderma longibrachiatum ATCC 18648]
MPTAWPPPNSALALPNKILIPRAVAVVSSPPLPSVTHSLALGTPLFPLLLLSPIAWHSGKQACVCVPGGASFVAGLGRTAEEQAHRQG